MTVMIINSETKMNLNTAHCLKHMDGFYDLLLCEIRRSATTKRGAGFSGKPARSLASQSVGRSLGRLVGLSVVRLFRWLAAKPAAI